MLVVIFDWRATKAVVSLTNGELEVLGAGLWGEIFGEGVFASALLEGGGGLE